MTRDEFRMLGDYATDLWPKFLLNPAQVEIWFDKMQRMDYHTARKALGETYASGKWKVPVLPEVLDAVKRLRQSEVAMDKDFPQEFIDQVQREEAEDAHMLSQWTEEQLIEARDEIAIREPGMDIVLGSSRLKASAVAKHFIRERFVEKRAHLFPGGIPQTIGRDAWWDLCAGGARGLKSVETRRQHQRSVQAQKVKINEMETA